MFRFLFSCLVLAAAPVWAQGGDECDDATALAVGANPYDSTTASDSAEPFDEAQCAGTFLGAMSMDLWWTYTAGPDDVLVVIDTIAAGLDTDLVAYAAGVSCPVGPADQIACDGDSGPGFTSVVTFTAPAGATHLVRVGSSGAGTSTAVGIINVAELVIGGTGDILFYNDTFNSNTQLALDCLGLTGSVTEVNDAASFGTQMAITTWTTIIVDSTLSILGGAQETAIASHITGGGSALFMYWDADVSDPALMAALGVDSIAVSFTTPQDFTDGGGGGALWTTPNMIPGATTVLSGLNSVIDDGDEFVAAVGATVIGEFASGNAAAIQANGGRTIVIGAVSDSYDATNIRNVIANAIESIMAARGTPTGVAPCASLNDECAGATTVPGQGSISFDTTGASDEGFGPSCAGGGFLDLWYSFTPTFTAGYEISTCGTAYDTVITVYAECSGTELDCNDDSVDCGAGSLQSLVAIPLDAGTTYLIQVGGFSGATGVGTLTVEVPPVDVSGFDIVLINGEGDAGGGLVDSEAAYVAALTAAGLSFVAVEPNGPQLFGCPARGFIYNNGTFPDDALVDQAIMTLIRDCVLAGNGAIVNGGANWGFQGPSDYDQIDGIDGAATFVGGGSVTDIVGFAGSAMDGVVSAYTQDQVGNDWNDALVLAVPGSGTESLGDNMELALTSPAAGYDVGIYYPHDESVVPGAGDTFSMSVEPAGFDSPDQFLGLLLGLIFDAVFVTFSRGDCNDDGNFNIGDPVVALDALFVAGTPMPTCTDACDANDDGTFDIADPVMILASLFISGAPPPVAPSYPGCGFDETPDLLECPNPTAACP